MEKLKFWFTVVIVSALGIYALKGVGSQVNIPSFQKFTQAL